MNLSSDTLGANSVRTGSSSLRFNFEQTSAVLALLFVEIGPRTNKIVLGFLNHHVSYLGRCHACHRRSSSERRLRSEELIERWLVHRQSFWVLREDPSIGLVGRLDQLRQWS